ncbi:MAG: hypothetical protein E7L00_10775 [Propionibacteriaceae bacterium]|nr:hypothetical protein [Propionibacteriaceae bacterium]
MTTATTTRTDVPLVETQPKPIAFGRVVAVEFRKFFHTASLRMLMCACLALMTAMAIGLGLGYTTMFLDVETGQPVYVPWLTSATAIRLLVQLVLPALVIVPVADEWTTRSVMTTFTLVPQRGVVVRAKAIVATVVTLVGYGLIAGMALLTTWSARLTNGIPLTGMWTDWGEVGCEFTVWFLTMASAFALALVIHNSALSIAIVLGAPVVLQIISQLGEIPMKATEWLNLQTSAALTFQSDDATGVWKLVVATTFWVVLPLIFGALRTLRREAA